MKRTIRTYVDYGESSLTFGQYINLVQMIVIPDKGWKNRNAVKMNITDLIIMGNEEPEKIYDRINYAIEKKYITIKQKAHRIIELKEKYILFEYDDKYKNTNYFINSSIFPILFFKNVYYPEELQVNYKATKKYRDLNRYLSDLNNIPYIDYELYNYYYNRGINVYDKETLKRNYRIVTCTKNKLY